MMDGEKVYRERLAECLAAAEASDLPQVRDRHLASARSWQRLLDTIGERKAEAAASPLGWTQPEAEDDKMGETDFEVPDPVAEAIDGGMPAIKAFRQFSGQAQHDVAVEAGMTEKRLAEIEQGAPPQASEVADLSEVLIIPPKLLVDR